MLPTQSGLLPGYSDHMEPQNHCSILFSRKRESILCSHPGAFLFSFSPENHSYSCPLPRERRHRSSSEASLRTGGALIGGAPSGSGVMVGGLVVAVFITRPYVSHWQVHNIYVIYIYIYISFN